MLQFFVGYSQPWNEHAEAVAVSFYTRGLAQNITMVGFLGE
jgi:spore coat protein U-like protein